MHDEVYVGAIREPPDWFPALRFRKEKLRGNEGACCDEGGVVDFPVGGKSLDRRREMRWQNR
jgi:hypothetical protein